MSSNAARKGFEVAEDGRKLLAYSEGAENPTEFVRDWFMLSMKLDALRVIHQVRLADREWPSEEAEPLSDDLPGFTRAGPTNTRMLEAWGNLDWKDHITPVVVRSLDREDAGQTSDDAVADDHDLKIGMADPIRVRIAERPPYVGGALMFWDSSLQSYARKRDHADYLMLELAVPEGFLDDVIGEVGSGGERPVTLHCHIQLYQETIERSFNLPGYSRWFLMPHRANSPAVLAGLDVGERLALPELERATKDDEENFSAEYQTDAQPDEIPTTRGVVQNHAPTIFGLSRTILLCGAMITLAIVFF